MKIILLLLLVVSCGKDASSSKSGTLANKSISDAPKAQEEMFEVRCIDISRCFNLCAQPFIDCVGPCGGQTRDAELPQNQSCQNACRTTYNACNNKPFWVTKEEYDLMH